MKLPTPYPIGPVYTYLIRETPITIIDVGVNEATSLSSLKNQLSSLGITFRDIEYILLTHGHSDHYGAAQTLKEKGAGKVLIHPKDRDKVTNRRGYYLRMLPHLARLGMPPDYLDYFVNVIAWETPYARDLEEAEPLREGDAFSWSEFTLEVIETPGHSPGHVAFMEREQGWAITGDFIFTHFTPDPIIDITPDGHRTPSMALHMGSIEKFSSTGIHTFYPGHREEKGNIHEALQELKHRIENKKKLFLNRLKEPMTPFQLMKDVYPESGKGAAFVLLSEVMGRLDLLEKEGLVESWEEGVIFYRARGTPQ